MAWQGTPFDFHVNAVNETLLNVGKLPTVLVDSGFGWDTLLGSVVAGAIPAFIAWYTIKKNISALENDRLRQQETFDRDRNAQLDIAAKNLNAQVLSANRQQWINSLRANLSKFISLSASAIQNKITWYIHIENIPIRNGTETQGREFLNNFFNEKHQMVGLATEIQLMLNPREDDSKRIIECLDKIISLMDDEDIVLFHLDVGGVKEKYEDYTKNLIAVSQKCLKSEWDRVKKII